MKTLIFVRHAKSSWDYQVSDRDRPLKERGIRDAHVVATHLSTSFNGVDAVFSSPANRALHTCMIFTRILNIPLHQVKLTEAMYDFGGESVSHLIRGLDNNIHKVMVFGHNYALTSLVNILGDKSVKNVTTSGVVIISFDVDNWNQLRKGTTKEVIFPKHLR